MKTEDLYLEYARVIKMCEGTNVKPWECVKYKGSINSGNFGSYHPSFCASPKAYEFAIAILEDKPVFVGDNVYHKATGIKRTIDRNLLCSDDLTWTKPEPKRTFTMNGVELPCPVSDSPYMDCEKYFTFGTTSIMFDNKEDCEKVFNFIGKLLSDARDKQ